MTIEASKVIASHAVSCVGASRDRNFPHPLEEKPTDATVDVLEDGTRQVGCPYLTTQMTMDGPDVGECGATRYAPKECPHLFPTTTPRKKADVPF